MTWSTIDNKELADTKATIAAQEDMLKHASNTIARLEGRWRAPVSAKAGKVALVITQCSMLRRSAMCLEDGGQWVTAANPDEPVSILAWHELPAIPSEDGFKELK